MRLLIFILALLGFGGIALADGGIMKTCGTEWRAVKAAGNAGNQSWLEFLASCRARHANDAAATPAPVDPAPPAAPQPTVAEPAAAAPAPTQAPTPAPAASDKRQAAHERIKACAAEWHKMKDAGTTPTGLTWPKFWHQCSERLKAQAGQ